ncbi:PilN domain-containing protein [Yokenella regensburgei]|uniref:PilN domain-containing protein n=1 Tax=Yokenella regensburgei TaxID=158877 RepID=UPI003F1914C3
MSKAAVNLLPWREARRQRCRRFWAMFLVITGVLLVLVVTNIKIRVNAERQIVLLWLASDSAALAAIASREPQLKAAHEKWVTQQALAKQRHMTRLWQDRLVTLARTLPESLWLTTLSFSQGQLSLSGLTHSFEALRDFEQTLSTVDGFHLQQTHSAKRDPKGRWLFHYRLDQEVNHAP